MWSGSWLYHCCVDDPVALSRVVNYENVNTLTFTCDDGSITRPLYLALSRQNYKTANWLLSIGAVLHVDEGSCVIHSVTQSGNVWWTRYLLRLGVNPNRGQPLDGVIDSRTLNFPNKPAIAALLLYAGARMDHRFITPKWVKQIAVDVNGCKHAMLLLVGLRRFERSPVLQSQPRDIIKLIACHIREGFHDR